MTSSEESGEEFRTYMKAANSNGGAADGHLSEALMVAYYRGEKSDEQREQVQAHLVVCDQCIALFRSMGDFLEPATANDEMVTAAETDEAWRSFLQRVPTASSSSFNEAETSVVPAEFQHPQQKKSFSNSRVSLALAASLLISFSVLGWLGYRLREERQSRRQAQETAGQLQNKQRELEQRLLQLEQSGGDQVKQEREQRLAAEAKRDQLQAELNAAQQAGQNIPVYTAMLSSERGAQDDLRLNLKTTAPATLLRLIINKPYEFPEYTIELFDERGELVRGISGLQPTGDEGALSVLINRAMLSNGKYRLRLAGQRGKTKKQLGEYRLTVTR